MVKQMNLPQCVEAEQKSPVGLAKMTPPRNSSSLTPLGW
jgi:hypothetical protein